MSNEPRPVLEDFIKAAMNGRWDWVDANLLDTDITQKELLWAIQEVKTDPSDDIRDLAASMLVVSGLPLTSAEQRSLVQTMLEDASPVVQCRLAVALFKRGNAFPEVRRKFEDALDDPDVGPVAEKYRLAA